METENTIQLIPINPQNQSVGFPLDLTEKIKEYGRLGLEGAFNTQRAYKADLKDFNTWCDNNGQTPFPVSPETLCIFLPMRFFVNFGEKLPLTRNHHSLSE